MVSLSLVSFVAAQQPCRVRYLLVAPPSSSATMVLSLTFSIPVSFHFVFLTKGTFSVFGPEIWKDSWFGVLIFLVCFLFRLVSCLVLCVVGSWEET